MKHAQIYHYLKCGTCRKAIKMLEEHGYILQLRHIIDHPPTEEELKELIEKSGLNINSFFNTSGEVYRSLNLKDTIHQLSEQEKLRLLSGNGKLIKRPVVTNGEKVTVGYKEEVFRSLWI